MENLRNKVYYEIQGLMIFLERCRSMTITLESSIIKNFFKITCNVLPLIFSAAGCIYILCGGAPLLIVADDPSFHFNLITVNALFGGFYKDKLFFAFRIVR